MNCILKYVLTLLLACSVEGRGVNGGFSCAACTIISGIADQLAQIHNETLLAGSLRLCKMLPSGIESYCVDAVKTLEPILVNPKLSEVFTPDAFCYSINICYLDPGQDYCHLFPKPQRNFRNNVQDIKAARGSFWRGRDCHDWDINSYPGRQPLEGDATADFNCNGIWGVDKHTGRPWEKILCKDYEPRGIIYIGDSVGAHFHFPEPWINPLLISEESLHNYTQPLLDELDWPHLGFATGFMNTTDPLLITGLTDSVYLRLRARNRCNHRDYQNLSQNGASSYDGMTYVESLARNQSRDKPALVVYGMYGNDVCNRFSNSVPHMTTPEAFRQNVMNVLNVLNKTLPFGSHVILVGLVDGGFIYPTMAKRIHPLGQLHGNIHYSDVYDWFNCMEMGPCSAWMTGNVTLRKLASKRAIELTDTLKNIVSTEKFSAFALHIIDNPVQKVMWDWTKRGKPVWQLLDPVDSLHPCQTAQPLLAEVLWEDLVKNFPEVLGDKNPHNKRIKELFGDQGGH